MSIAAATGGSGPSATGGWTSICRAPPLQLRPTPIEPPQCRLKNGPTAQPCLEVPVPHRILVVDDEPHIREVITFALERAGLTTTTARNGTEAVQAFRRGGVDLIVLDIGMPEMDGLEVCK